MKFCNYFPDINECEWTLCAFLDDHCTHFTKA